MASVQMLDRRHPAVLVRRHPAGTRLAPHCRPGALTRRLQQRYTKFPRKNVHYHWSAVGAPGLQWGNTKRRAKHVLLPTHICVPSHSLGREA
jgi:hypothetical protein